MENQRTKRSNNQCAAANPDWIETGQSGGSDDLSAPKAFRVAAPTSDVGAVVAELCR